MTNKTLFIRVPLCNLIAWANDMFRNQRRNNIYKVLFPYFFGKHLKYKVTPISYHQGKQHKGCLMSYYFVFARLLLFYKGLNKAIRTHVTKNKVRILFQYTQFVLIKIRS
jgi:hypothetical protein